MADTIPVGCGALLGRIRNRQLAHAEVPASLAALISVAAARGAPG